MAKNWLKNRAQGVIGSGPGPGWGARSLRQRILDLLLQEEKADPHFYGDGSFQEIATAGPAILVILARTWIWLEPWAFSGQSWAELKRPGPGPNLG